MIIRKSELQSIKSTMTTRLEQDSADATKLNQTINGFKNSLSSASNFEGEIFNKIQQKLNNYEQAIKNRIEAANNLSQKINSSLTALINKMGSDEMIDTSLLETLKKSYNTYNSEVIRLRQELKNSNIMDTTNSNRQNILRSINANAENALKVKKEIEKIEDIISIDSMCQSQLSSIDGILSSYKQKTNEIASNQSSITIL